MIRKVLIFLITASITSFCANTWAQSYIYLTNNTLQPLELTINQSGSPLIKGEHWFQHEVSVAPLATVRFLEMNRDTGIKWGKDYFFDTTVTAEDGSSVVLQQKLTGTFSFSNIWHGTKQSSWFDDREIHSVTQDFVGKNSTIAFKAESARTNGDDYYYVIHPKQVDAVRGLNNNINVLAYNVWALNPIGISGIVSKSASERFKQLKDKIKGYDAIVFSELFANSERAMLLDTLKLEYPYQTRVVDKPGSLEDGGVLIVSRWPIEKEAQMTFQQCSGSDCMASKGVMYALINKGGNPYHIFGSHTQAWSTEEGRTVRAQQFEQMRDFIDNQNISGAEPVIIAGDLNVDKIKHLPEYEQMLKTLIAEEVPRLNSYAYTFDGTVNAWTTDEEKNNKEYLDYVLYSTSHLSPISSSSKVIIPRSIHADVFTKYDLSDHFGLAGDLTFDTPTGDTDTAD